MKKAYSLDYSIERDTDRLKAIEDILDTLDTRPSNADLEQMASYILYGKDENGQNAVKRGEVTDSNKRYTSFTRAADKNKSLDEILDNPLSDQQALKSLDEKQVYTKKKPSIKKPKYDKAGNLVDIGDADIPGMTQLWENIDRLEKIYAVSEGKLPPDEETQPITDSYRLYQFKHMLIDVRRHQYYLKDAYKPTLHFLAVAPPKAQTYDWDSDSYYWMPYDKWRERVDNALLHTISKDIADYETRLNDEGNLEVKWVVRHHTFDWENPQHIKHLINYYSAIYMQVYDKMDSWGRTLIYDFDRYFNMCGFSPVREYILTRRIDKATFAQITQEVQEKFGIKYNETHLSSILNKEIPERMATVAKKHRQLLECPMEERKQCYTCKQYLPRNLLFFSKNQGRRDGFSSNCKECEKKKRIARGGQPTYDRRNKEATLFEVQTGEAGA